jgi:hypothetical protein
VPWERHWSSRRWARQRSAPWMQGGRLPGRAPFAPRGRPPPPPPTRTAGDWSLSHARAAAGWSARAPRSAARRCIPRRHGGPDRRTAPGLGGRERRTAWRPPRGAGLHRLSGRPSPGGPSALRRAWRLRNRATRMGRGARSGCRSGRSGCARPALRVPKRAARARAARVAAAGTGGPGARGPRWGCRSGWPGCARRGVVAAEAGDPGARGARCGCGSGRPWCVAARPAIPERRRAAPRGGSRRKNRRRPTLPGPCEPSTIGAVGLNCSVRNGKRCFPHAIATGSCARPGGPSKLHSSSKKTGYQSVKPSTH